GSGSHSIPPEQARLRHRAAANACDSTLALELAPAPRAVVRDDGLDHTGERACIDRLAPPDRHRTGVLFSWPAVMIPSASGSVRRRPNPCSAPAALRRRALTAIRHLIPVWGDAPARLQRPAANVLAFAVE